MANYVVDNKTEKKTCLLLWNPPSLDWVKLNVDGSMDPDSGSIAAGGVIRDHKKNWLGGFTLNKGMGSVIEVELWGIFEGLKIAWKAGYKKVIVETDSQMAVLLLKDKTPLNHPFFSIIQACKALMEDDWSCHIVHIYRECNKVVDCLAGIGHSLDFGITLFEDPPPQISSALNNDAMGIPSARLVPSS
ncbi:hypothetical protein Q3G72_029974 [Acer saccharum]|nr:hypothetical protein Q3G72_029974 [Acer saccharum]